MGIIQKQAVRTTTVVFAGLAVGVLSRIIMPFVLSKEQIGLLALLDSVSGLFAAIFTLGFVQIAIRGFPKFRDETNGHHGFLLLGIIISVIGAVIGSVAYYFLRPIVFGDAGNRDLLEAYSVLIIPIIVFRVLFKNLDAYVRMLFSSVVGAFLESFLLKAIILISILLFWVKWFDYTALVYAYLLAFSLPGIIVMIVSFKKTVNVSLPHPNLLSRSTLKEFSTYSFFGLLATISGTIVITVDQIMITRITQSVADVGAYSILFFAGALVSVPGRGTLRIATPILAEAWNRNDLEEIHTVYRKSSITNMVSSTFLFVVGWACLTSALTYLPTFQYAKYVYLFIGLGQFFNMLTGANQEILATSAKYKMNSYFNVVLALLVILLNLFFIPRYGIVGAAIASCIAMVIINLIRWYYLKLHFGLQPLTGATGKLFIIGIVLFAVAHWDPLTFHPLANIAIYLIGFSLLYWPLVLRLKLSPDINAFVNKLAAHFLPN